MEHSFRGGAGWGLQGITSKLEENALARPGAQLLPRGGGGGQGLPLVAAGFWSRRTAGGVC